MSHTFDRRQVLRGLLGGSAVTVALPILDCMLNDNGDAFAATGKPLPTRFATWMWPLGFGEGDWVPKSAGADYELPLQLAPMKPFQKKMNFFTGHQIFLDGRGAGTHFTTIQGMMTGNVGKQGEYFGSMDAYIADAIGEHSRFKSLVVSCSGDPRSTWSARPDSGIQAPEISPYQMYVRIFGPEYKDPNAATFTPDPDVMLRRSVLSGITDKRKAIMNKVGASDREKLDSYFTSLRTLEQKLDVQLEKPDPLASCTKSADVPKDDGHMVNLTDEAMVRHDLFTQLLVHAFACDQNRVANLVISAALSGLRRAGDASSHHTYTHEEAPDPVTGFQPICGWFQQRYMKGLHDFAAAFENYKEGDGNLLDRMLIFAYTDHGAPRYHSVHNYPMITIGNAGGRLRTGMHIPRPAEAATRVSYTLQLAMGVPAGSWGTKSNRVTSPVPDVLA